MTTYDSEYWNRQFAGIDMSTLANFPPTDDEPPCDDEATTSDAALAQAQTQHDQDERNTLLVMATLAGALRDVKDAPDSMHSAMIICRLANGTYRFIFPHSYSTITLKNLADATRYFEELLEQREE